MAILESWFAPFRRVKRFLSPLAPRTTEAPNETVKLNCQIEELNRKLRWTEGSNEKLKGHNIELEQHNKQPKRTIGQLYKRTVELGECVELLVRTTAFTKSLTASPCLPKSRSLKLKACVVGMIGWQPIFRSSNYASGSDLQTNFGPLCAKRYPLIIVDVLPDCMMAVLISTAGGDGLRKKPQSIRDRSIYVVKAGRCTGVVPDHGKWLGTRVALAVSDNSGYYPPEGAFVDMLNTFQVPYDSRFEKKGQLTAASTLQLVEMRRSAVLACSKAAKEQEATKRLATKT